MGHVIILFLALIKSNMLRYEPKDVKEIVTASQYSDSVKQDILKHSIYHWTDFTAKNELPNFSLTHSGVNLSLLQAHCVKTYRTVRVLNKTKVHDTVTERRNP